MIENKTIDFVGAKSIDAANSGHDKTGFTTCLSITGDGVMLTPYVVFGKLKNIPNKTKCSNENNLFINVSQFEFMNDVLQVGYKNLIISHLASLGHIMLLLPARSTSFMKPFDFPLINHSNLQ